MQESAEQQNWDLVIKSKSSLFSFHWRELWSYRDLLFLLVKRDIVSFYKQTLLGPLWFFLQPLIMTMIYIIIFGQLAGISTDGQPKALFYLSGIVAWNYFSECLLKTSSTFKDNASIFGKVYFPRIIMPLSVVCSNLIRFLIQFGVLLLALCYFAFFRDFQWHFSMNLFLLPVLILLMAVLGLAFGMLISSLTTKYRDFAFLVGFGVQLAMYATPIIYPLSAAPAKYHDFILLNPMSAIVESFRSIVLGYGSVDYWTLIYPASFAVLALGLGILLFNRVERNFMDTV